jgi:hypothetical protein
LPVTLLTPKSFFVAKYLSVELNKKLQDRIARAMAVSRVQNRTDFTRSALIQLCRKIENDLRASNPTEYALHYEGQEYYCPPEHAQKPPNS